MGNQINMSYDDMCMFLDVHLPARFKMPIFNLYDGFGDPVAHLRGYCSEMRSVGGKEDLLMTYFSEDLTGAALQWYTHQDVNKWHTWDEMAQDFVRHFQYNIGITPDRSSLSNMEKKPEKSFREFGLRWREQAARVSTPISEEEMVELFIQAQGPTYFSHLIPALGKPFKGGIVVQNPDAVDTSKSLSPIHNETHMVGMICFEKKYENSSEILGGPHGAKLSTLSEVDLKNEPAKKTQMQFAIDNVMETCESPSNVDAKLSG
ncbi:uncharacterized protein [Nicotiana sylvestris]|uniref:uncharacterized protein n=1 Tax=Nicotiana sylvestris TaxID=4096 RepID=UPI00388C7FB5